MELGRIPRQGLDLYLRIDDGLDYRLPAALTPSAFWAIDTHLDFDACLAQAYDFDWVFAAQRDGAERLRQSGIASARWLPLACDPEIHARHDVAKTIDVCFVGNLFPGPRSELVALLQRRFPNTIVGRRYFDEMARTYSASRIVFNRSLHNDVNMRVFEALACGSLLVTNDLRENGQDELFQDGVHLSTYAEPQELLEKIAWYLAHEDARERLAAAGRAEALAKHTYRHRMQELLRWCENGRKTMVSVSQPFMSPSAKTDKDAAYFEHARPELAALVPTSARRVLDIGCGAGALGAALKSRQPVEVVGIERCEEAARRARARIDRVVVGDVETLDTGFGESSFDCIVCGDVLEHLREPLRVLSRARNWLAPDGCLIASIPNVRHHTVVRSLLNGNWTYESAGLLDADHVRFFTRREIEKLFFRAGFKIRELTIVPGEGYDEWSKCGCPGEVRIGALHIGGMHSEDAKEFFVYQYLIVAVPEKQPDFGLTSIVIVTHNEFAYTQQCIDSIRRFTDEPYEIIVVDNGSTDGTVEHLRSLADVQLIGNPDNRGFPAAANQGIRAARGRNALLLNNDCVVTTGWLRRLLEALHSDPKIGLAGPYSNNVSGEQQVPLTYGDLADLDGFAWEWGKTHNRLRVETDRLVGFCLLIRRELVGRIGLLDEQFGIGCFEDDDYCRRARQAGYRAVIAQDAFVHHFGSRTFTATGIDFAALMRENERRYRAKWEPGIRPATTEVAATQSPPPSDELPARARRFGMTVAEDGALRLTRRHVLLSLCMIVRDNEQIIRPCLESIRPWVDEMIVVDTGSTDRTPEICKDLGARVYHFPWCDSFAAARNESLKYANGEWIFWMDSDDTIDENNGRKLRALVEGPHDPRVFAYILQTHCPGSGADDGEHTTIVDQVKLLRNRSDLRFDFRLHEQILPSIRRAGGELAWTNIFVVQAHADHSPDGLQHKLERDLRILDKDLAERPEHAFVMFNLGMTYADANQHDTAIDYLKRCLAASGTHDSHVRKAHALLIGSLMQAGRFDEAFETCQSGLRVYPADPELLFREGALHLHFGRLNEAERSYRTVLEQPPQERFFSSVVSRLNGHLARQNLAIVYEQLGDFARAETEWRAILAEKPCFRTAWRGLGHVLVEQNRIDAARAEVDRLLNGTPAATHELRCEGQLLEARIALAEQDRERCQAILQRAIDEFPDDLEPLRRLCEFLFAYGEPADAAAALRELVRQDPNDASAHHNLGTAYLRMQSYADAADASRESLRLRPNSAITWVHLGYALKELGALADAIEAWNKALAVSPGFAPALEALRQASVVMPKEAPNDQP